MRLNPDQEGNYVTSELEMTLCAFPLFVFTICRVLNAYGILRYQRIHALDPDQSIADVIARRYTYEA